MEVLLADSLKGALPFYALTGPCGYMEQQIEVDSISRNGYLFRIKSDDFHLELKFENDFLILVRNGKQVMFPVNRGKVEGIYHTVNIAWTPNKLMMGANGDSQIVETQYTKVPSSIIKKAKMENLIPSDEFLSQEEFRNRVNNCFATLSDKIEETMSCEIYWDNKKDGSKIIDRKPKLETSIQSNLHALLYEQFMSQSIEVVPENNNAKGRLDFALFANVKGAPCVRIVVTPKFSIIL